MNRHDPNNIFTRNGRRRVVVTGLGAVTPLGLNAEDSWKRAVNGESGIDRITQFDASEYDSQIAGEVTGFDPEAFGIAKKDVKKMGRFIQFALASTQMALKDAGIESFDEATAQRAGSIVGVGMGDLSTIENQHKILSERGPGRISPFFIPSVITNLAAGQISIHFGTQGPNYSVTSACASGNHSVGEASQYIRSGLCDVMIAGGAEATVCPLAMAGFAAMKALSTRNDQPQAASRPWDKGRDGFVLAEGSGILILEDFEHAEKRGATIYAEVTGYGTSSDAYHMTNPSAGGKGAALAMINCLKDAGLNPSDIGYINAHGTSTPAGDEVECQAVKEAFKSAAEKVLVSSTKSMTGHGLGAAGAMESVFSLMALKHSIAPPTINLDDPSEGCDLDFVANVAREQKFSHVLNNSFGFGGTNACLSFSEM